MNECQSYRRDSFICSDGFVQNIACSRLLICDACWMPSKKIPACLRDELPAHWVTESGAPRFYLEDKSHD